MNATPVRLLMERGVAIPAPDTVFIGDEVDLDRISPQGVIIHPGCRLKGSETLIMAGTELGAEAPVTLKNAWIGPDVTLKGGYFEQCVFLKGAAMGSGAHVRQGTIFEEYASGAHCVGVKQTILFPYVTLGSLINFCDCLMAGGTGPKNHSEVGSSYIHFNFTPHQDKATPSMLGDVPRGVMLDQAPIFLGGQGGLVGPCRIGYGNVIAAGTIYRKDALGSGKILMANPGRGGSVPFQPGVYLNVKRLLINNIIYIANLMALNQWYGRVRKVFAGDTLADQLHSGLMNCLGKAISERINRLAQLGRKVGRPLTNGAAARADEVCRNLDEHLDRLIEQLHRSTGDHNGDRHLRDDFLNSLTRRISTSGAGYIDTVATLTAEQRAQGTAWLDSVVAQCIEAAAHHLPAVQFSKG